MEDRLAVSLIRHLPTMKLVVLDLFAKCIRLEQAMEADLRATSCHYCPLLRRYLYSRRFIGSLNKYRCIRNTRSRKQQQV